MDSDIKNEINRILASEDDRSWNQLFKFLHQQKEHPELEGMVDYAGQLMNNWKDESRSDWPKENFHFKSYYELSPAVKLIRHLKVSTKSEEWGAKYLNLISKSPYVSNLKAISISSSELYAGTLTRLFESPFLMNLESLSIKNTLVDKEEMNALIKARFIKNLTRLTLIKQKIDSVWVIEFLKQIKAHKVTYLDISFNRIGDLGAQAIANAPVWSHLELMNLKRNQILSNGKEAIRNSEFIPKEIELIF